MVEYSENNVFNVSAQTMVNTVNCFGVMGSGLALEFKARYRQMYEDYARQCKRKEIETGRLEIHQGDEKSYIINFPTKFHWKNPSKIEWIERGLEYFLDNYQQWNIESVAFPKLGCDLGGLDWQEVRIVMDNYLSQIEDIKVIICLDEADDQGITAKMVEMINDPEYWLDRIKPGYGEKIKKVLPVKRFKNLQKSFKSDDYIYLFNLFKDLAWQDETTYSPDEERLILVGIFQELGIPPEEMLKLSWNDVLFKRDWYWLKLEEDEDIHIFPNMWRRMKQIKDKSSTSGLILHDLKNPDKPIKISYLKKMLKQSSKYSTAWSQYNRKQ